MAQPEFKPGDKVQNLCRSAVVMEVEGVRGHLVRCVTYQTFPATAWGTPERIVPLHWDVPAFLLTHYRPAPLPKVGPIDAEIATPHAIELSEVAKLELFYDGRIPRGALEAARRRDAERAADYAHALATAAE